MCTRFVRTRALGVGAALSVLLAAQSASAHGVISITHDRPVLWVNVTLSDASADHVGIRILRPARRSQDRPYQRCDLPYSGPGTYRCGIDVNTARRHPGTWVARAFLDG